MTKPTGKPIGRPGTARTWRSDPDASVIVVADAIQLSMPKMTRAAALKLSILWHNHPTQNPPLGIPVDPSRPWNLSPAQQRAAGRFDPTPIGKSQDDRPEEGFLRSERKRITDKEKRLTADQHFQRWRRWAVMTAMQLALGPLQGRRVDIRDARAKDADIA